MRRLALLVLGLAFAATARGGSSQSPSQPSIAEQYLFQAANAERAALGLAPVRWNDELYSAADAHAFEMARRQNISHQYAGEPELAERGKRAGVRFSRISENVAEAPNAVEIHSAWMHSEGHRENLLDPTVTAVGIRVLQRDGELYAVEDFAHVVETLSADEQERRVTALVENVSGLEALSTTDARRTCRMETGYAGGRRPYFVMRFTASDLTRLPQQLQERLASRRYQQVAVGACSVRSVQPFTSYNIAVLLYP